MFVVTQSFSYQNADSVLVETQATLSSYWTILGQISQLNQNNKTYRNCCHLLRRRWVNGHCRRSISSGQIYQLIQNKLSSELRRTDLNMKSEMLTSHCIFSKISHWTGEGVAEEEVSMEIVDEESSRNKF